MELIMTFFEWLKCNSWFVTAMIVLITLIVCDGRDEDRKESENRWP